MGTTKKELIEDLLKKPESRARDALVKRAMLGEFHDFDTPHATPKILLVAELNAAGFADLAERVKDGAYDDESPTPQQRYNLRQALRTK